MILHINMFGSIIGLNHSSVHIDSEEFCKVDCKNLHMDTGFNRVLKFALSVKENVQVWNI